MSYICCSKKYTCKRSSTTCLARNLLIVYKINKVMQEETNDGLVAMSNISGNAPKNHRQKRGRDDEEDREPHDANLMEMQRI